MENDPNSQMQSNTSQTDVPSQPIKNGGKGPIIAIVVVIIIAITGIALTWYFVNNNANKKAQEKETKINELTVKLQELNAEITKLKESQSAPSSGSDQAASTGNDQEAVLTSIKALYKDRAAGGKTEAEKIYFTEAYYNTLKTGQFGADPILCAQNVVEYDKLVFNNPTITGTNATISVKTQYGTTINIKLVKQNNVWLVSSVTCP